MTTECPQFTMHRDPVTDRTWITVDRWPSEIEISADFIDYTDAGFIRRDGDTMTMEVSNGRAVYRLGDLDTGRHSPTYLAYRISSRWSEPDIAPPADPPAGQDAGAR